MGRQAPAGLLGIHTNLPATIPGDVAAALATGRAPAGLSEEEQEVFDTLTASTRKGNMAYVGMLGARPQALAYGGTDSPAGLAAFMLVHPGFAAWTYGEDPEQTPTKDEVLDNFTLYWLTNSAASAARLYWENREQNLLSAAAQKVERDLGARGSHGVSRGSVSIARNMDPSGLPQSDLLRESRPRRSLRRLGYPDVFARELRAAFRPVR